MHKRWDYRKGTILIILTVMFVFTSSCGNTATKNLSDDKTEAKAEKTPALENLEDGTISVEEETPETTPEVNVSQTVLIRHGKKFLDYELSESGDVLYYCGNFPEDNSFYFAELPEEGQSLSWNCIEPPDDMAIREITTDSQDNWHILLMELGKVMIEGREFDVPTYEVSYIWTINREGEVEKKLDVSPLFTREQRSPINFMIDVEGNYYFDNENEIIRLNPDGNITMRWSLKGYEIEALACGKSGKVYCIYEDYQGADILELLEEDGIADLCISLPEYDCKYGFMAAGVDAELLIFNLEGGVYAYADGDAAVKQRIWKKDMPVSGQDIFWAKILKDGRLVLMTKDGETEECLHYYIPTAIGRENE